MIVRSDLLKVKSRALRLNVWFKVLSRTERAIIDLTMKCVERVRSHILEAAISDIVDKIIKALESRFLIKADEAGRKIAEKLCTIAYEWGNKEAFTWKFDSGFIRSLGVNAVNQ